MEMTQMLQTLNPTEFSPRIYLLSHSDSLSYSKLIALEERWGTSVGSDVSQFITQASCLEGHFSPLRNRCFDPKSSLSIYMAYSTNAISLSRFGLIQSKRRLLFKPQLSQDKTGINSSGHRMFGSFLKLILVLHSSM